LHGLTVPVLKKGVFFDADLAAIDPPLLRSRQFPFLFEFAEILDVTLMGGEIFGLLERRAFAGSANILSVSIS